MEPSSIILLCGAIWLGLIVLAVALARHVERSFSLGDLLLLVFVPMIALFVFAMRSARRATLAPRSNADPDANVRAIADAWKKSASGRT